MQKGEAMSAAATATACIMHGCSRRSWWWTCGCGLAVVVVWLLLCYIEDVEFGRQLSQSQISHAGAQMRADAGAQTRRDQCRAQCRQRARRDLRLGLGDCPRSAASCPCTTTAVVVAAASREMRKINRARLSSGGGCNNSLAGALPLHTSESVSFIPRVTAPVCASAPEAHASSGG